MTPTGAKRLHQAIGLLTGGRRSGRDLWHIISALRGPDFPDPLGEVKNGTTAVIRAVLFPEWRDSGITVAHHSKKLAIPADLSARSPHFYRHVLSAAERLGLIALGETVVYDKQFNGTVTAGQARKQYLKLAKAAKRGK